jgi:hypothetical protein
MYVANPFYGCSLEREGEKKLQIFGMEKIS